MAGGAMHHVGAAAGEAAGAAYTYGAAEDVSFFPPPAAAGGAGTAGSLSTNFAAAAACPVQPPQAAPAAFPAAAPFLPPSFSFGGGGGGGPAAAAAGAGAYSRQTTRAGIDRPAVDAAAGLVPLLSTAVYGHRVAGPKAGLGLAGRALRAHALWGRKMLPLHALSPWDGAAAAAYLCCSTCSRTRTPCSRLRFFPGGQRLLTGTQAGELSVWSGIFFAFEDMKRLPHGSGGVTALEWTAVGDRLYVGDARGHVVALSPALNAVEDASLPGLSRAVASLSAAPWSSRLLAGCADACDPLVWDTSCMRIVKTLHAAALDTCSTSCLQWHPWQALIASSTRTGWIYLWDPRTARPLSSLQPHRAQIHKIAFHPYGNILLTCSRDSLMRGLDLRMLSGASAGGASAAACPYRFRLPGAPVAVAGSQRAGSAAAAASAGVSAVGGGGVAAEPLLLAVNPVHANTFAVGDSSGGLTYFSLLQPSRPLACIQTSGGFYSSAGYSAGGGYPTAAAAESGGAIVSMDWHPCGHLLVTASSEDRLLRFWSRGVPGGITPLPSDLASSSSACAAALATVTGGDGATGDAAAAAAAEAEAEAIAAAAAMGAAAEDNPAAQAAATSAVPTFFAAPLCDVDGRGGFPFAAMRVKDRVVVDRAAAAALEPLSEKTQKQQQQRPTHQQREAVGGGNAYEQRLHATAAKDKKMVPPPSRATDDAAAADPWSGWLAAKRIPMSLLLQRKRRAAGAAGAAVAAANAKRRAAASTLATRSTAALPPWQQQHKTREKKVKQREKLLLQHQ